MKKNLTVIVGAGPVGLGLAIALRHLGYKVIIYEEKTENGTSQSNASKSFNITISSRGKTFLSRIELWDKIAPFCKPLCGRAFWNATDVKTVNYTNLDGHYIYSISRNTLIEQLREEALSLGVEINYSHKVQKVDFDANTLRINTSGSIISAHFDFLFGTDGVHSILRSEQELAGSTAPQLETTPYAYKKIECSSLSSAKIGMDSNRINLISSGTLTGIAVPNQDGSNSILLVGEYSELNQPLQPTTLSKLSIWHSHIPDFNDQYNTSTIRNFNYLTNGNWRVKNTLILGDASHAMTPFYGQGTNTGFEDISILTDDIIENDECIYRGVAHFAKTRPTDTNAIVKMSNEHLNNLNLPNDFEKAISSHNRELEYEQKFKGYYTKYFEVVFRDKPFSEILNDQKAKKAKIIFQELEKLNII